MIALLFSLFLVTGVIALLGYPTLSLTFAYSALVFTLLWFLHHASDSLTILL